MSLAGWLVYLMIAVLCGLFGQLLAGRSLGGFLMSMLVGLGGAALGPYLAGRLHVKEPLILTVGGHHVLVVWTICGAALLTLFVSLLARVARGSTQT